MREVEASCSSDLDLGQAGRAREGGGGSLCFFLFPLPIGACGFSVKWHGSCRDSKHISWHLDQNSLRTPHLLEFRTNGLLTARMLLGALSALRRVAEWRPQGKRTRVDVGPTQLKLKLRSIVDVDGADLKRSSLV